MNDKSWWKKLLKTLVKVSIAVLGLWWVLTHTPWDDQADLPTGTQIRNVRLEQDVTVTVIPKTATASTMPSTLMVRFPKTPVKVSLAEGASTQISSLVISQDTVGIPAELEIPITLLAVVDKRPPVHEGLRTLITNANPWYLLAAWAILFVPFLVTAWRWRALLQVQNVHLPYGKCLALTFVGQFYSTFLPGITGGDLVKIVYTARMIGSKTKSTITILLDRVIGLVAVVLIAGVSAAIQAPGNPVMLKVALLILSAMAVGFLGTAIYFSARGRALFRIDRVLGHSRMPDIVRRIDEVMLEYRRGWRVLVLGLIVSIISQLLLPISVWLAGLAFGVSNAHLGHYLAFVPLALLAGSVPLSPPQGFGVIEYVMFYFFCQGNLTTAAQAFALAQAVRFLPILWNLLGAYWVVRGGYSRHDAQQQEKTME